MFRIWSAHFSSVAFNLAINVQDLGFRVYKACISGSRAFDFRLTFVGGRRFSGEAPGLQT